LVAQEPCLTETLRPIGSLLHLTDPDNLPHLRLEVLAVFLQLRHLLEDKVLEDLLFLLLLLLHLADLLLDLSEQLVGLGFGAVGGRRVLVLLLQFLLDFVEGRDHVVVEYRAFYGLAFAYRGVGARWQVGLVQNVDCLVLGERQGHRLAGSLGRGGTLKEGVQQQGVVGQKGLDVGVVLDSLAGTDGVAGSLTGRN